MRGAWRWYYSRAYTISDISYWKCTNVCRLFACLNVDCLSWQLVPQTQDIFVAFGLRSVVIRAWIMLPLSLSRSSPVAMRVHPSSSPLSFVYSLFVYSYSIHPGIYYTHGNFVILLWISPFRADGVDLHAGLVVHYKIALTMPDR
jgi:hypothetical protein